MKVLITGGAGYIGSTVASALEDTGHTPVLLDSLVTGPRVFTEGRIFYEGDVADKELLTQIFSDHPDIYATVHCAALIVVPESVAEPYRYYHENVCKSLELFRLLTELEHPRVVFSSSASIYDVVPGFKVTEDAPLEPSSTICSDQIHDGTGAFRPRARNTLCAASRCATLTPSGPTRNFAAASMCPSPHTCSANW